MFEKRSSVFVFLKGKTKWCLRQVLHDLKDRQHELQEKLEQSDSSQEEAKIQQEIDVIKLQRAKGAEVYQRIKLERQARK